MNGSIIFIVTAILFAAAIAAGLKVQKKKIETGFDGMIGLKGEVIKKLDPEGKVFVHGETWNAVAVSGDPVGRGEPVTVESVSGNTLMVRRIEKEEVN